MTDAVAWKKKLIEVALPLDAINAESAREKSIRHGHPSTLHLWWARRPLAACRAVLFAQLVDDPSAHPGEFPTEQAQDAERQRLFRIIENLVKWENSTNEQVLEAARVEIRRSCDGNPPPILDPFAGGGSIPLEAQRLGLEVHASDLNPVAVLINKALIEIPPRWVEHPPVHPEADNRTRWQGAEGLAEDVRRYGKWMRDEAEKRIGHLYPRAKLADGVDANIVAWIWTRAVVCPNPVCRVTMPLASTLWLSKRKGEETWIRPVVKDMAVRFEIGQGSGGPPEPPKLGRGARFRCVACGETATDGHIKQEGMAGRMTAQLMAVVAESRGSGRVFLPPTDDQEAVARIDGPTGVLVEEVPEDPRNVWCKIYGFQQWRDFYTGRQLTMLSVYADLIGEIGPRILRDAKTAGLPSHLAETYMADISVYLALTLGKAADRNSTLCAWEPIKTRLRGTFQRHALPMSWDFAEANSFGDVGGDFRVSLFSLWEVVNRLRPPALNRGSASQEDARTAARSPSVTATDPPYYDNIGYADLSDFFYVWLRRSLGSIHPGLLTTVVTPKQAELVASPYRHGGSPGAADLYFESGFVDVFTQCGQYAVEDFPMTLFYAFKQSENIDEDGLASTGWSTMLEGLARAGWMVTATWPIRTEMSNRMIASGTNALASSVVLACRRRSVEADLTDRSGLVRALQREMPKPLRDLQKALIAPVDLRQAAIGPGMAVYSRFARVIEPDGSTMRVRTALGLINQVLGTVLDEQEGEFDAETRWAIHWFSQFFGDDGPYGVAEQLAVSMNVSVKGMEVSGILCSGGGKVRIRNREELPVSWEPTEDPRTSVWEAAQHLVKRLEEVNEAAAGQLLRELGGLGESARLLAYRLYTVCEKPRPVLAGPYNALVASWPEIQRHAKQAIEPMAVTEQQPFKS